MCDIPVKYVCFNVFSGCDVVGMCEGGVVQIVEVSQKNRNLKENFHLLFHILGRYHEHQRVDRTYYMQINWENILEGEQKHTCTSNTLIL